MLQDLRLAVRQLWQSPGFTALVALTLAVAIGGTTAVFTLLEGVLWRPLPYPEADRVVTLWSWSQQAGKRYAVSGPDYRDWKEGSRSFSGMARFSEGRPTVVVGDSADSVHIAAVSPEFFAVMGTPPRAGRVFGGMTTSGGVEAADLTAVVVSTHFARRHFPQQPDRALGARITMSGRPVQVVGIMPPDFDYPQDVDLWAPLQAVFPGERPRSAHNHRVVARLRPQATLAGAQAELNAIAASLTRQYPENRDKGCLLVPLWERLMDSHRRPLWLLFGAMALVLLIACANVANLLLARGARRAQEIAVRAALGAGRARLFRQLLTESLLLAALGGALGLLAARWSLDLLLALAPAGIPRLWSVTMNGWTFGFAALTTGAVCLLVGTVPAAQLARQSLAGGLRAGRTLVGSSGRLRGALVVGQLAISTLLLTGAGLLLTSLERLARVDPGYRPARLLVMEATHDTGGDAEESLRYFQQLSQRAASQPGVEAASFADSLPVDDYRSNGTYWIEGRPDPAPGPTSAAQNAVFRVVGPDYFTTIGVPIVRGRQLDARDLAGAPRTVVINQAMAQASWPGADPVGQRIRCGWHDGTQAWMTIVGVVASSRQRAFDQPAGQELFVPAAQHGPLTRRMKLVVRTIGQPEALGASLRRAARQLNLAVPVHLTTAELMLADTLAGPRFRTLLVGLFAACALLLAVMGVAGVMSYLVTERRTEIGVRLAVGAQPHLIVGHFLGRALRLAGLGLALGLAGALAIGPLLGSLLFEVSPADPVVLMLVAAALLLAALVAAAWPAARAARVSPMAALRAE